MNAIAMTASGELFDPFSGRADIDSRLIRCVGDPQKRFEEDALRILRALRFSAVLGFDVEPGTMDAAIGKARLIAHVAPERISAEVGKALKSPRPETAFRMLEIAVFDGRNAPFADAREKRIRYLPQNAAMRWAALCALMSGRGLADAREFLLSLKLDSFTVKHASAGCELARKKRLSSPAQIKGLIAAHGDETARCALAAMYVLYGGTPLKTLREVLKSGECCRVSDLAVTGGELLELGFSGKDVGRALQRLLERVIENPDHNERGILITLARDFRRKNLPQ